MFIFLHNIQTKVVCYPKDHINHPKKTHEQCNVGIIFHLVTRTKSSQFLHPSALNSNIQFLALKNV